jgi:hypothetical protein
MKQRTTNNNKNENMKMRKKLITALVLGACVGTQAFAQSIKEDTLTFSLSVMQQSSVSTSTALNAGNFSQGPTHYKTATTKMTQTDVMKAIAFVLHKNGGFYTSQAKLVLVQGELGGFWNINDALAQSYADFYYYNDSLLGSFNDDGADGNFYDTSYDNPAYHELTDGFPDGDSASDPWCYINDLTTYLDNNCRTSIADGTDEYARLDTGRHFLPVPFAEDVSSDTETPIATTGQYPPGHMQPWGQIYVKDPGHKSSSGDPLCENVTFFFYLSVQECYDCFYLNSFISDATFTTKQGGQNGPPCCTSPNFLLGKGTDKYYLSLSFDNTINNSYLNPAWVTNSDANSSAGEYYYAYVGFTGVTPSVGIADGTTPDLLVYSDPIRSRLGLPSRYEMRFTLNGIVTYNWSLMMVNSTDVAADFVGTASYSANGYGFIGLVCSLITGSATFTEKIVKDIGCCDDTCWWDNQENYASNNGQGNYYTLYSGWYGPGGGSTYDAYATYYFSDYIHDYDHSGNNHDNGYFNPDEDQFNPYPFPNVVGGEVYGTSGWDLPYQNESPYNPQAGLTSHGINNPTYHDAHDTSY